MAKLFNVDPDIPVTPVPRQDQFNDIINEPFAVRRLINQAGSLGIGKGLPDSSFQPREFAQRRHALLFSQRAYNRAVRDSAARSLAISTIVGVGALTISSAIQLRNGQQ